ncbi:MAG: peptidyl-prolyl cis-trans isomerase [Asticcacaulis sp.]
MSKQSEEIRTRIILLKTRDDADTVIEVAAGRGVVRGRRHGAFDRPGDAVRRRRHGHFTTDIMPAAYKDVLATAKVGDTVGPVQTDGGWAILRVEDRRPEQLPTLEEERPVIMRYLVYNQWRAC